MIFHGDCFEKMHELEESSIDAIVTDPPYGLAFMEHHWDYQIPSVEIWQECLRVLKPGGHLLCFAGSRTQHRMACNIEDAGFEIRDIIMWVYGSGFPKSQDVGKQIDKFVGRGSPSEISWLGWGTALKPAYEPIIMARKPLLEKTVIKNVMVYGTGAINIDGCRVPTSDKVSNHSRSSESAKSKGKYGDSKEQKTHTTEGQKLGRYPANFLHDGSEEVVGLFPETKSGFMKADQKRSTSGGYHGGFPQDRTGNQDTYGDSGSAARFFYCAKASSKERGENTHPTVKPVELMNWLVKLICPAGSVVLDPFMGSGTTGVAAKNNRCKFIGIEREKTYFDIAKKRLCTTESSTNISERPRLETSDHKCSMCGTVLDEIWMVQIRGKWLCLDCDLYGTPLKGSK